MMRKCAILLALLTMCLGAWSARAEEAMPLRVVFFDAGKADAILVQVEDKTMLIDTGLDWDADALCQKLAGEGVETIDLMIVTHFDKDHIGGAEAVLERFPVLEVIQPDYEKSGSQMYEYLWALEQANLEPRTAGADFGMALGGAQLWIDAPNEAWYGEDEENDFSLVVTLVYGENRFLFAGDAEEARIAELLQAGNLRCDVLKVPHHGKKHDNNPEFFEAAAPRWAVITSSDEETEKKKTVEALTDVGAQVLLTRQGDVVVCGDGTSLTVCQREKN